MSERTRAALRADGLGERDQRLVDAVVRWWFRAVMVLAFPGHLAAALFGAFGRAVREWRECWRTLVNDEDPEVVRELDRLMVDPQTTARRLAALEAAVFPERTCDHEWRTIVTSPPADEFGYVPLVARTIYECRKCYLTRDYP